MGTLFQDLSYGFRMLAKNPGFTAVAVLTLSLGIGANTAIFSVLDAVLLRSLPVERPQQLVVLTDPDAHGREFGDEGAGNRSLLAFWEFEHLHDHNDVFASIFAADSSLPRLQVKINSSSASAADQSETATVRLVSGDFFSTLGVKATVGRVFTSDVDRARGASPFAVISYAFWKQRFGLELSILGKTIQIHRTLFEVIGVAPPGFFGETVGDAPDIWVPLMMQEAIYPGRDLLSPVPAVMNQYIWLQVMARLKPGVTLEQAKASINVAFKRMLASAVGTALTAEQRQQYLNQQINLQPGARGSSSLHGAFADPLKVLMGIVGLVLFIACANVANLMLARGAARQKEFAVRMAIGGGRSRLIRQLLTESLLLALLGAAAGLVLAQWADSVLVRMVSGVSTGPESVELGLQADARILGFTVVVAVLTAILFGLAPALRATRLDLSPVLKSTSVGTAGGLVHRRLPAGKLLVIAQVAVSLVLLVAAGLFVHSLARLSEVNLGYNREKLLLFRVDASPSGYKGVRILRLHQSLLEKFSAIPGVRTATLSSNGLFQGGESGDPIAIQGYTPKAGEELHSRMDHVGPGYFSTVGIPVLAGREIGPEDSGNVPRAAVVNQAFARAFFPHTNPIGKRVRDTDPGNPGDMEIVGVVADAKYHRLREDYQPRIFLPYFNPLWEHSAVAYEVRILGNPAGVSKAIRQAVEETDSTLLPIRIETMSELVEHSLDTDRFIARLSGAFGLLAMLLAAIGLYGLMAYNVARRTRDIGIRMALGAQRGEVFRLVVRQGLLLTLIGVGVGVAGAFGLTRYLSSLLYGVRPTDPATFAAVSLVLTSVALLASYIPARRATKVDPMVALRHE
jgi:predicted permease